MPRLATVLALALASAPLAFAPLAARAEAPDLDVWDLQAGEDQVDASLWGSADSELVRAEFETALDARLGLELQAEATALNGHGPRITSLSAQLTAALVDDHGFGVAAEVGWNPQTEEAAGEAFVFVSQDAGAWRLDADLGVEREDHETGLAYAWRLRRPIGGGWSAHLEGGGGLEADLAGAGVGWSPRGRPWEVSFSWFADLGGGPGVARLGLDLDL